jgi:hypothetical protein
MAEINPWVTGIGAGVSILGNGINALRSNKFMNEAKSELSNLVKNPIKPFSVSAPMQSYGTQAMSEAATPMGFSGAEKSSFDSGMGRTANSIYEKAMSIGGGSGSRAIQGILSAGLLDQTGNFAAKDAMLREERRQKAINRVAGYASGVQNIDNMNVNANINAQSDLNRSIGINRENIGKFWGNLGGLGGMAFGYGMMGGFGGDKTTPGEIETGDTTFNQIDPRRMDKIPTNYDPTSFGKNVPKLKIPYIQ